VFKDAVSEVKDETRVIVCPPPAATIVGPVATDLVHLIAELVDNAVDATPGGASVTLGGVITEDNGLLVEVTDSGPGLSRDLLQTINARLASAPGVDPLVAGQTGLFITRELAGQHGVTVRLRQRLGDSGTTATVLLPPYLVMVDLRASTAPSDSRVPSGPQVAVAAESSGPQEYPPLQVSVIDETTAADLFSPASISPSSQTSVTSPGGRPRTAQEEWSELFGSPSEAESALDSMPASVALDGFGSSALSSVPSSEVREEIFEMVSAWFRERRSGNGSTMSPEWQSPLDEGWQAAQALRSPMDHEMTEAGLPKRQPRAHLVSGADDQVAPPQRTALARTPEEVRGRLSRYQRGLRVGRHARSDPAEHPSCTDTLPRPLAFEYRSFEE
jgi:hypothetical protein